MRIQRRLQSNRRRKIDWATLHGIQEERSSIEIWTKVTVSFATNQFKAWKFETEEWERKEEKEIDGDKEIERDKEKDGDKEKERDKEIDREQLFILLCHNFTVILWQPSLPPLPLLSLSITHRIQFSSIYIS